MFAIFNLLSLVVGAVIGAVARSWLWVIGLSIVVGAGSNMIFDVIWYSDPFRHPDAIILDSVSFLFFGVLVFLLRLWNRKRKLAEEAEVAET